MQYRIAKLICVATWALLLVDPCGAQEPSEDKRTIDRRPFDRITLKASDGGEVMEVTPLSLDGRRVPSPLPTGQLTVQLVSKPGIDYLLPWSKVRKVELYEQLILQEANELTQQKQFDQAFDYYAFLDKNYSQMPGLARGVSSYLQANALDAFRRQEYDLAMAILLSYYERNPRAQGMERAVEVVANKIISAYKEAGRWRAARGVVDVVETKFNQAGAAVARDWRDRFQADADRLVRTGATAFREKRYRAARDAAQAAVAIVPDHRNALRLKQLVEKTFPNFSVGVRTLAPAELAPRIDSLPSVRASRLAKRTVTELSGYSPEGGVYSSPLGNVHLDDSGDRFHFTFPTSLADRAPAVLARQLLQAASSDHPSYQAEFASVARRIGLSTTGQSELVVQLHRPHIRPEALLSQTALSPNALATLPATYQVTQASDQSLVMTSDAATAKVAEIEERLYEDDGAALGALISGEIKLLDRVYPWQLNAVRNNPELNLGSYDLPTVHVLVPTKNLKLLDNRGMRRALLYALNRQQMLQEVILGGRNELGFQVVSGPLPIGRTLSDPIHYGYNDGEEPRPHDPRLGALLAKLAWVQTQKAEHGKDDPAERPFPSLTLAHNSDPVARTACQSIQMQLRAVGVPIKMVELSESELLADEPNFDLRYAELAVWEPLVDAQRLLGPDGIAGRCSDPMLAALQRLDNASNWPDVSAALREVHTLAAGELPLIPLWQTVNFFGYRKDCQGVTESAVTLYQTVERWSH